MTNGSISIELQRCRASNRKGDFSMCKWKSEKELDAPIFFVLWETTTSSVATNNPHLLKILMEGG